MTWIDTIDQQDAQGTLKTVYDELAEKRGKVSNILKIHSLIPKTMKTHLDLYLSIMFNSSKIKREDKELIALVVSIKNNCEYCINHHAEALVHYWKDTVNLSKLIDNMDISFLNEKQQIIANHATKLTDSPHQINERNIALLRKHGFSDTDILEITLIVSYFNFVNRIALGLDVGFSEKEMKGYKY